MKGCNWADSEDDEGFSELCTLLSKALLTAGVLPNHLNEELTKEGTMLAIKVSKAILSL